MHLKAVEVFNLVMVAANERVNQQQFRQALDVLASHMAITVNRMGERGWVARGRQMQDRRAQLINLTPAGAAITQKAEKIASKIQAMAPPAFCQKPSTCCSSSCCTKWRWGPQPGSLDVAQFRLGSAMKALP